MRTTLHCQWYVSQSEERNAEIEFCARRNLDNESIDRFVWYVPAEDMASRPAWLVGDIVQIPDRLTYGSVLRKASDPLSLHILINTDIVVTPEAVGKLRERMHAVDIVCLTRWESSMDSFPACRLTKGPNSQDLWAWWGNLAVVNPVTTRTLDDIPLGVPACDNRVAYEFSKIGHVLNPAHSIKTMHIHASAYRTYTPRSTPPVPRPYRKVPLTE
jgi:hypothetical protein